VAALAADLTITMATMCSGLDGKEPIEISNKQYFGIFAAYILFNALMNSLGLAWLTLLTQARPGGGGEGGYESREAPPGARCGPCGREAGSR
jgi:hypothetical protein